MGYRYRRSTPSSRYPTQIMKIVYLPSCRDDLLWMRKYYEQVFPDGQAKAKAQFQNIKNTLLKNPYIGHLTDIDSVREMVIPKVPFSFIYRIKGEQIQVLRIWDERQGR